MELNFGVMIDSDKNEEELIALLLKEFPAATKDGGYIRVDDNVIQFTNNFGHDSSKVNELNDGWMYYKYDVSVFPVGPVSPQDQHSLAKKIIGAMRASGDRAELVAEFDE